MTAMEAAELCPRPITKDDVAALIGVLAVLQGEALSGELDIRLTAMLGARVGGVQASGVEAALDNVNQRLRYALGEYDGGESPAPR